MGRVTVKTIAEAVGVSPSTVSNAYNRPDQLSAELRERILAVAAELGYAGPDAAARMLRSGRAEAVGVLLTERLSYAFSDPYAIGFLTAVTEVLEQSQTSLVLMPIGYEAQRLGGRRTRRDRRPAGQHRRHDHPVHRQPAPGDPAGQGPRDQDRRHRHRSGSGLHLGGDRRRRGRCGARTPPGRSRPHPRRGDRRHRFPRRDGHHRPVDRRHHLHRLPRPAAGSRRCLGRAGHRLRRSQRTGFRDRRRRCPARRTGASQRDRRAQRRGGPRRAGSDAATVVWRHPATSPCPVSTTSPPPLRPG